MQGPWKQRIYSKSSRSFHCHVDFTKQPQTHQFHANISTNHGIFWIFHKHTNPLPGKSPPSPQYLPLHLPSPNPSPSSPAAATAAATRGRPSVRPPGRRGSPRHRLAARAGRPGAHARSWGSAPRRRRSPGEAERKLAARFLG